MSSIKLSTKIFLVVCLQQQKRVILKNVIHVQSCCFVYSLTFFDDLVECPRY